MYSKEAMDAYQRLLNRELPLQFAPVNPLGEKTAGIGDLFKRMAGGKVPGYEKALEEAFQNLGRFVSRGEIESVMEKLHPFMPNQWKTVAGLGIPASLAAGYGIGKMQQRGRESKNSVKDIKDFLIGLSSPDVGPYLPTDSALNSRAKAYRQLGVSPEVADFSSI